MRFNSSILTAEDFRLLCAVTLGRTSFYPDLIIAPDGKPYLYRWHLLRTPQASVYFHIQVASDPERPLHDHPWDNTSVILSGGYDELWQPTPYLFDDPSYGVIVRKLRKGDTVFRRPNEAHRLILPPDVPYSMSLFTCGPKVREWGFWYPDGWRPYTDVTRTEDGVSVHLKPEGDHGEV